MSPTMQAGARLAISRFEASAGRLVPPVRDHRRPRMADGLRRSRDVWTLDGALTVAGEPVSLAGGTGYHDHNWGFWKGVSWQWGQAQQGDLSGHLRSGFSATRGRRSGAHSRVRWRAGAGWAPRLLNRRAHYRNE